MQCTFMGTLISNKNKIKLWYFTFGLSFQILIIYLLMSNCLKVKCLLNMSEKTNRSIRSPPDVLERVAKQVLGEGLSYRKAAENFGVDKMTLAQ